MPELHWSLFHRESPYAGFDTSPYPDDPQGWNSRDPLFRDIIEGVKPQTICEVGSWKGASAIHMAEICRELGLEANILCIDTWLGSPELLANPAQNKWFDSLNHRHGYPQLYYTFLANAKRREMHNMIVPLPMPSETAAFLIRRLRLTFDVIYIDGAHDYEGCLRDLKAYWPFLAESGVLFGDDYVALPGVTRAVVQFAHENEIPVIGKRGKYVLTKRAVNASLRLKFEA